jgi:hypothetical protein
VPRVYTVTDENRTYTAADTDVDMLELLAATDKPIELIGLRIHVVTEVAEAQEEWLRIKIIRGHTTSGNGSAASEIPVSPVDTAAGFAAEVYATTLASAGTAVDLDAFGIQVRAGAEFILPEGLSYWTSGSSLLVVRCMSTPADNLNYTLVAWVKEYP